MDTIAIFKDFEQKNGICNFGLNLNEKRANCQLIDGKNR